MSDGAQALWSMWDEQGNRKYPRELAIVCVCETTHYRPDIGGGFTTMCPDCETVYRVEPATKSKRFYTATKEMTT